ncbi:hypothetical protein ACFV0H_34110 [Streptomyces erythrochromogenes]|uniref:Uncharacterized protein n=1 Tax=Streptomyces erythrochromogenes TaxID=285574 RepID=A0ABZ1QHL7_9ACTN|nr:hypothetical protein [Streptomyces erythrochromogenes]MCX5587662.1 hypothetical protein [Streptomyces erythrochromogenes]
MTDEAAETRAEAQSTAGADAGAEVEAGAPAEAAEPVEPAGPAALGVVRTPTGHAGVDAHLARLADADHLGADGHVEVYEDVHRGLREALTALDAPPVPGPYENRS